MFSLRDNAILTPFIATKDLPQLREESWMSLTKRSWIAGTKTWALLRRHVVVATQGWWLVAFVQKMKIYDHHAGLMVGSICAKMEIYGVALENLESLLERSRFFLGQNTDRSWTSWVESQLPILLSTITERWLYLMLPGSIQITRRFWLSDWCPFLQS